MVTAGKAINMTTLCTGVHNLDNSYSELSKKARVTGYITGAGGERLILKDWGWPKAMVPKLCAIASNGTMANSQKHRGMSLMASS